MTTHRQTAENRNMVQRILNWCAKILPILMLGCLIWISHDSISLAGEEKKFDILVENGGFIVKGDFGDLQYREREAFIPASTLKILTCLAALDILGEEYRFETHFSIDDQHNLYIKGYGDPFLTSEVLRTIAEKLYSQGVRQVSSIRLDETAYTVDSPAHGAAYSANPFDAPNGALAVNFNSVPIVVFPDGTRTSGEVQTPEIPIMHEIGRDLPPGTHRVNVNILPRKGPLSPTLRYTGELITTLFNSVGITIENGFYAGRTPDHISTIYIHSSEKCLRDIVRSCLQYSNNYIANQLFLACGASAYGFPANWEKARRLLTAYAIEKLHLPAKEFYLEEGSGLSRRNRISPAGLLKALEYFRPYADLLNIKGKSRIKSGTLSDVFCYAGFLVDHQRLLPFVILLNQQKNNRDELLEYLSIAISGNFK